MITDLAAQRAMDRLARHGFDALSDADRTLATVWLFAAGVANQGFARYFASRRGELAFHAPAALRAIGAVELAAIAADANAVFGPGGPRRGHAERRAQVNALPASARAGFDALERRYFECEEDVDALLEAYLSQGVMAVGGESH